MKTYTCPLHCFVFSFLLLFFNTVTAQKNTSAAASKQKSTGKAHPTAKGLKDYYKNYFPIGVSVTGQSITGADSQLIVQQFNSVTPENAMKMGPIHPEENRYNWKEADAIVDFAAKNGMRVRGHTLCWHQQTPDWVFKDGDSTAGKELVLQRLKKHIQTVVGRYKGRVYAWDVVNEAIDDDSTKFLRNSMWYKICGEDFIAKAFEYAHEADPHAVLFYNDYHTEQPERRERIYQLLQQLKAAKVPVQGVGLQAHWSLVEPTENELVKTIELFSSLHLQVQITELDISVLPPKSQRTEKWKSEPDVYTADLEQKQVEKYKMVFDVFRRYKNKLTGVTFWNVSDKTTWLDSTPSAAGKRNYPLLFDVNLKPKKAYEEVIKF